MGLLIAGLALRLYTIDARNLWYDEVISVQIAQQGPQAILAERFGWVGNQTIPYYFLLWLAVQPLDPVTSAILVRLPEALASALIPLVVFGLGQEMFGWKQGLLACGLTCFSVVFLEYAQDTRPYAILAFCSSLATYCLVRATRSKRGAWWLGLTVTVGVGLMFSYMTLVLVLPALAPFVAWALWKTWRERSSTGRTVWWAGASATAVFVLACLELADMARMPRTPFAFGLVDVSNIGLVMSDLLAWAVRFGMDSRVEHAAQLCALPLAGAGVFFGFQRRRTEGVVLCLLVILVPEVILGILYNNLPVYPRYSLFAVPFCFILLSEGLFSFYSLARSLYRRATRRTASMTVVYQLARLALVAIVALFAVGAYNYAAAGGLAYRPDFRGVTAYLNKQANMQDLILFVDDPALGYTVTDFYWRGRSPAPVFDARDPRLFLSKPTRNIYWVMSSIEPEVMSAMSQDGQGPYSVQQFPGGVLVLQEKADAAGIEANMDRLVQKLDTIDQDLQFVKVLTASLYEARGDIDRAAGLYWQAGAYFLLGDEFLRTGQGFEQRGLDRLAWREAVLSKFMQAYKPQVHLWMAQKLKEEGQDQASQAEYEIAQALQRIRQSAQK